MKVVVTGAAGFVGGQIVRALVGAGDEVYAVVRPGGRLRPDATNAIGTARVVEADLLRPEGRQTIAALGTELCVHAAWYAEPGRYLSSMLNLDLLSATLDLARLLGGAGCRRFVGIGTCFEYDTAAGYLSTEVRLAPAHLYSAAKASAYFGLMQLGALLPLEVVWARLFYLYGPAERPARLVPSIARALLRGEEAKCSLGQQVRDFLHVEDAGTAIGAIAHSEIRGAINVASGQPVTVARIAAELGAISGSPHLVRLGALPYPPNDPMFICADVRPLQRSTGWRPRFDLTSGLADAFDWWSRNPDPA